MNPEVTDIVTQLIKQNGKKKVKETEWFYSALAGKMTGGEYKHDLEALKAALYSGTVVKMLTYIDGGKDPDACLESASQYLNKKHSIPLSEAHEVLYCFVEAFGISGMFKVKYPASSPAPQEPSADTDSGGGEEFWNVDSVMKSKKFNYEIMWEKKNTRTDSPKLETHNFDKDIMLFTNSQKAEKRSELEQQMKQLDLRLQTERPKILPFPVFMAILAVIVIFNIILSMILFLHSDYFVHGFIVMILISLIYDLCMFFLYKREVKTWNKKVDEIERKKRDIQEVLNGYKE